MPSTLGKCWCKLCDGKGPDLSTFIRQKHKKKYGIAVDIPKQNETTSKGEVCDRDVQECLAEVGEEPEVLLSHSGSRDEVAGTCTSDECAMHNTGTNSTIDQVFDERFCADDVNVDEDVDEDLIDSMSDSESEDEQGVRFSQHNIIYKGIWSFSYDKHLYSSGLAVQKLSGSDLTVLQWLAMNFHMFSCHPSMSKSAFSDSLKIQRIAHNEACLPSSYIEAKKMIKPYLVQKVSFDVCSNDCVVYRNSSKYAYADLSHCPVCSAERYYNSEAKKPISKRKFQYLPLGPRLARIYGEANLGQLVYSHPGSKNELLEKDNQMWDIHDAPIWKDLYSDSGFFRSDKMGLSFALEVDGVNPFHNIGVVYSMTPIMLTILNLPRHIRNLFGNILLVGIIKGNNKSEASTLDPYIEILVDELLFLSGCTAFSEYHNAPVQVKLKLLLYVLDYPGMSKLFNLHGSGSLSGCHWCTIRGIHCPHLQKVIYLGNRSFLKKDDPIRHDSTRFYNKSVNLFNKPMDRFMESEKDYRTAFQNASNKTQASSIATATGCKGNYALLNMQDHDRLQECCPDACHTIKDVVQNIVYMITGKKVNKQKITEAEKHYGRGNQLENESVSFSEDKASRKGGTANKKRKLHGPVTELDITTDNTSEMNAFCPYFLTSDDIKKADERGRSIKVPLGFGLKPFGFIGKPGSLKSHDWKQLGSQGVLKFCLRGMLGSQQRKTFFMLLDCISDLCDECQCLDKLDDLETRLNVALALLERDFPLTLQNITTHILHHIVGGIKRFGPVYGTWMFVFERFNSWLCQRALNMQHPESTALETYILFDWCQFVISSGAVDISKYGITNLMETPDIADDEFVAASTEHSIANSASDVQRSRKQIQLNKRQLDSIHRQFGIFRCNHCSIEKYYCAEIKHPVLKHMVKYSCMDGESESTKTVSSFVCFENDRGDQAQKLTSGKFIVFGRIKHFIVHKSDQHPHNFAYVGCYDNAQFDIDSGLWFVESTKFVKFSYLLIASLSSPLVAAMEGESLWFCNCKKLKTGAQVPVSLE